MMSLFTLRPFIVNEAKSQRVVIWVPKDRREIAAADGALLSCMAKPEILNTREVKYL